MATQKLKPTTFKNILIATLFVAIIGSIIGFYFAKQQISDFALQVNSSSATTNPNLKTQAMVDELNDYVDKNLTTATTATNKVITTSTDYQKQITTAIDAAASSSGLTIAKSLFGKPSDQVELSQITGLTTNYVTLNFSSSVNYTDFIEFLQAIENSTPKMQVMGVNITPDSKNAEKITVTPLVIGFYTR